MDYWSLRTNLDYKGFVLKKPVEVLKLDLLEHPHRVIHEWVPLEVEHSQDREDPEYLEYAVEREELEGNNFFGGLGMSKTWDDKAMAIMQPLIRDAVEFLPVIHNGKVYHFAHVLPVLKCLDHRRSKFKYFKDGGIDQITHYVFKKGCLDNHPIFRLKESPFIYVSDTFRIHVEENGLLGLEFEKAWEVPDELPSKGFFSFWSAIKRGDK